jgi:hypothetical protein
VNFVKATKRLIKEHGKNRIGGLATDLIGGAAGAVAASFFRVPQEVFEAFVLLSHFFLRNA